MPGKKYLFLLLFCSPFFPCFSQSFPVLKQQFRLDRVEAGFSLPGSNTLLVKSLGNNYTLIDQFSKIQLGTLQLDIGSLGLPGLGQAYLTDPFRFIVSTGRALLSCNILDGKTDTLFGEIRFPGFITGFIPLPGDPSLLLIAAKTYPVDKNGEVHFSKPDAKNQLVYDDSRNGRLVLFDSKTRKVVKTVPVAFIVTVMAPSSTAGRILAGSFDGDILETDSSLNPVKLFHAFDRPVHSLLAADDMIVTVPHIAPKFIGNEGAGMLYFFNRGNRLLKTLTLPDEIPQVAEEETMRPGPSSQVKRIFGWPKEKSVLVNYGFSRLLKISLPAMDTVALPLPVAAAEFFCFNRDSSRLLAATDERTGVFGVAGDFVLYDLNRKRTESFFRQGTAQEKYKELYKFFDRQGNYHILALRRDFFKPDTIIIYSSNRSSPSFLTAPNEAFILSPSDTALAVQNTGDKWVIGKLRLENLRRNVYRFYLGGRPESSDTLPSALFDIEFDSRKSVKTDLPFSMQSFASVGNGNWMTYGLSPSTKTTLFRILVIDRNGQTLFRSPELDPGIVFRDPRVSPSGRWLAYHYEKNNTTTLEAWDWKQNKKIFSQSFTGNAKLHAYGFDKTKDILFFGKEINDRVRSVYNNEIYKVDPAAAGPAPVLQFRDPSVFSFETDIENDLVASEGYNVLQLHRLSDHQLLWRMEPYSTGFSVRSLPGGFALASETELHMIGNRQDHIYFTSYRNFRPVEILNGYLYRGDKQAMNNLAFVYKGRGFLPGDFDIYFNRPDSVLIKSGSRNAAYNELLEKTVRKRNRYHPVKDLREVLENSPELSLAGKETIPELVQTPEIRLAIRVRSREGHPVRTLWISDNGIPVFGKKGIDFGHASPLVDTIIPVPLVQGGNRLQLSAETGEGYLSAPEYLSVRADFAAPSPRTWFVGIGVSRYRDTLMNLRYADKDIRDLAQEFAKRFPGLPVDTLLNERATREAILALKEKLKQTGPEDKVVVSLSGHGLVDSAGNFYFATYEMDFAQPGKNGLRYPEIENLLSDIPARKRLLWIDACHSGELDREAVADTLGMAGDAAVKAYGPQRGGIIVAKESAVGLQNSFELMRELFTDAGRSDGTLVISAAGGLEFALEDAAWQNGVFTWCVKKGLLDKEADANKDSVITVGELKEYVSRSVETLTGGRQKPTGRRESVEYDWELW